LTHRGRAIEVRRAVEAARANGRYLAAAALVAGALLALYFVPRETAGPTTTLAALEFLGFGLGVGAYGTMVGAGGGFLIVPALLLVYHARPEQAAGTSLAVVCLNALSGTVSYARQGRVDYRAGLTFAVATLPGAVIGAFLARLLGGRGFDLVFGALLLVVAILLIWRPTAEREYADFLVEQAAGGRWAVTRRIVDARGQAFQYRYHLGLGFALSVGVGFLSSALGIGGGIIHVPALIHLLGFPAHIATATSQFILVITAAVGTGTHLALGNVLPGPAILMGIGVVGGAQIGASLARHLGDSLLVRLLSLALLAVAARLLLR
jgi:hypothetical protein